MRFIDLLMKNYKILTFRIAIYIRIKTIIMYFSYVDVCAILSDDRINNRAVKTLITKIAEEWVMINSRGFEENATFQRIQLFCFFYFRNSGCKGINAVM